MSVMKKFGLAMMFILLMYFGGLGTQSDNTAFQGIGAVCVLVSLVLLFALFKVIKTNFGAFSSFIVFGGITLFILYSLGWLKNINSNFNKENPAQAEAQSEEGAEQTDTSSQYVSQEEGLGLFAKLFSDKGQEQSSGFNPEDYPAVEGYADAITGAMLSINGLHIKLLGVEAPYLQQTCANKFGQAYTCGQTAKNWLQNWLQNKLVKCHIISPEDNGRATGVCFAQGYDIGAVVVNAGWAVAYTKNTDIYVPYEQQAGTKKRGLWAGTFYKPWDWKKLQSRKSNIKVETIGDSSVSSAIEGSFDEIMGMFK